MKSNMYPGNFKKEKKTAFDLLSENYSCDNAINIDSHLWEDGSDWYVWSTSVLNTYLRCKQMFLP